MNNGLRAKEEIALTIIFGIFLVLHGLVHLLYAGQSVRFFELRPGMTWPDGSWLFPKFLSAETTRLLGSVSLVLAALGFVTGGLGLLLRQAWWQPVTIASALFSTLIFVLFWNGRFQALDDHGAVGILINLAILAFVLVLKWPA